MFCYTRKPFFVFCFIGIFMAVSVCPVYGAGGDGSGGGNGENRDIPLTLVSTSVADGASGVAINETIQLDFNKNVCDVTVLSNNRACFHLTDENGEAVAIKLLFPDNQVQKKYKDQAFIQPADDLEPNTTYEVAIDSTLAAKNGTSIDNAHVFSFTTGNSRTDKENAILTELDENIVTYETAYGKTADSVPVNQSELDALSQNDGPDTGSIAKITAAAIILLIIILIVIFVVIRRKAKA